MSSITTVNLKLIFKDNVPDDILKWLVLNNDFNKVNTTDEEYAPEYIVENASRCSILSQEEYEFKLEDRILTMNMEHKNKDNDWEHFINFLTPYIDIDASLGFYSNSTYSNVEKIIFKENQERMDSLELKNVVPYGAMDKSGHEIICDIDDDIDDLEKIFNTIHKGK